jgi:anti-sigma factor RsiW
MTGRIIRLRGDRHQEVQSLLPWYLTDRLEASERAEVEAHLAECPECQAELRTERRLGAEVAAASVVASSGDAEHGWAQMRRRIEPKAPGRPSPGRVSLAGWRGWRGWTGAGGGEAILQWRASPAWLRWAAAGQFGLLLLLAAYLLPSTRHDLARYRALGAAPAVASGNVVVIFRPDTSERALRETLKANDARIVDGPTATDAYLLHVPAAERGAALDRLRRQARIELAEPVDSGVAR